MRTSLIQDDIGTHMRWALDGVTPRMIDWFWSNMEKGFMLWHPEQHEPMSWPIPPRHGNPLGAIHNAPQTWDDGRRQDLYIRFEHFAEVPDFVRNVIEMEHVIIVAGLGLDEAAMNAGDPMGYRVHQWQKSDAGVEGLSSAIGTRKKETHAEGLTWAAHAGGEIDNWEVFLPDLYRLYKVINDPKRNPFSDLSVEGRGHNAHYKYINA